jgi:hypothetical protein
MLKEEGRKDVYTYISKILMEVSLCEEMLQSSEEEGGGIRKREKE